MVLLNKEMDQRKLFDSQTLWKQKSANVFIRNLNEFSGLRNKLDVYYDSTEDDESIYLVNLLKTITHTLSQTLLTGVSFQFMPAFRLCKNAKNVKKRRDNATEDTMKTGVEITGSQNVMKNPRHDPAETESVEGNLQSVEDEKSSNNSDSSNSSDTEDEKLLEKIGKNRKTKTFCILIQETKLWKLREKHEKILKTNKLKYEAVPAIMNSGGLMTIIPRNCVYEVIGKTNTCLAVTLTVENQNTTIVNTYINPKDTLAENFIASIEELNLDNHQDLIIAGDFNAIDFEDYENLDEKVKSNDIRVLRHRAIITKLNELVLAYIGKKQIPVSTTQYDRRSKKHRIDFCFSNAKERNLELAVHF